MPKKPLLVRSVGIFVHKHRTFVRFVVALDQFDGHGCGYFPVIVLDYDTRVRFLLFFRWRLLHWNIWRFIFGPPSAARTPLRTVSMPVLVFIRTESTGTFVWTKAVPP